MTTQVQIADDLSTEKQMAKLYVHVGIPKSGTTTIQDVVCNDPKIHYIKTFYYHKALYWLDREFELDTQRPNLVSDETFVVRGEGGRKVPIYVILQRAIDEGADVKLLLTIRNQKTSLPSMFKFRILLGNSFRNFADWLGKDEGMDFYSCNQYGPLIKAMTGFVPKENIKVMMFEELCADKMKFYAELYDFMDVKFDPDALELSKHSNKTPPREHVFAKNTVNRFIGNYRLTKRLKKLAILVLSKFANESKMKAFYDDTAVVGFDSMTEEIKRSNRLLLEFYPELESKLREHGYPL
jgi:hypothetical protein